MSWHFVHKNYFWNADSQKQVVDGPEPWCAPAFFVPMGDGISVRMVTDFTHINRFVIRPVHPFPSVQDILQCIPAGTAFLAKMDAIHGYFQLALDEESSRLTTFLLPSGRYRYLRAPMGLSSSSDEWCRHSDTVLEGLPYARLFIQCEQIIPKYGTQQILSSFIVPPDHPEAEFFHYKWATEEYFNLPSTEISQFTIKILNATKQKISRTACQPKIIVLKFKKMANI